MRILLVEDDDLLADAVSTALRKSSFQIEVAQTGTIADLLLQSNDFDAVILDLGLPEKDGVDVLKALRERRQLTPVLVVTARTQTEDMIGVLDVGADDYITKPFRLPVLEARLRALLRRAQWERKNDVIFGSLRYDVLGRRAYVDGQPLELSAKELGILELLLQRSGRVVSKEQIADQVYDAHWEWNFNAIEVAVHRLRKKLEPSKLTVQTIRGLGYTLGDSHQE